VAIWFSTEAIVLIIMPIYISKWEAPEPLVYATGSLLLTYCFIFLMGLATSVLQSTIYSFAALLPPVYTQAVMGGNGVAGVVVSFCRVFTKVGYSNSKSGLQDGAVFFFVLSAVITFVCVPCYFFMQTLPIVRYYTGASSSRGKEATRSTETETPLVVNSDDDAHLDEAIDGAAKPASTVKYGDLLRKLSPQILNIIGTFLATFIVFPGIIASIKSHRAGLDNGWLVVILLTEFNVFDWIGRTAPKWLMLFSPHRIWIPIGLRILFFPAFLVCVNPEAVTSDIYVYIMMSIFAISNGYLSSLVMMFGPTSVAPHERETAGGVMSLFLNVGILLGTLVSIIFKQVGLMG